jgi:hypothetical protein
MSPSTGIRPRSAARTSTATGLSICRCRAAAGYEDVGEGEKLLLTSFKTIIEGSLVNAANVVVNFSERYQVKIPDEWVGLVTVKAQPDAKEWRFVLYNGSLSESTVELCASRLFPRRIIRINWKRPSTVF